MTNFIPIFPLGIVVYPGEDLNLHIFEPRYKQLISECYSLKKSFGIPVVIENKVQDFGSMVEITRLSKLHDNGEMDIMTKGIRVFRILEIIKDVPDKLYNGAIVNYPDNYETGSPAMMLKIMNSIRDLHRLLNISKDFKKEDGEITCYEVAHHIGFSLEEEYELLGLFNDRQRQEHLNRHLTKVITMLTGMEKLKEKIKGNGHFKDLRGYDLDK
jgi:uncharacterized protein